MRILGNKEVSIIICAAEQTQRPFCLRVVPSRRFHFASTARRAGYIYMRISPLLEDFEVREQARGCTSAGLHSRRVEDNIPYILCSGYADLD